VTRIALALRASVFGVVSALTWSGDAAQAPGASAVSPMLNRLERGQWELRGPNNGLLVALCLGNPILLAQPQHGAAACARDVVAADESTMTVNYVCAGAGRGRTTIRFETPRLIQVESQGLDHGVPFALRAQGRRVGECG
jgi:hypothetical protein